MEEAKRNEHMYEKNMEERQKGSEKMEEQCRAIIEAEARLLESISYV